MFKLQCAKIMCKKLQNKLHPYHSNELIMNYSRQTIITRQRLDVQIFSQTNNLSRANSLNYKVGTHWNKLPLDTKMLAFKTTPTFVKHLKRLYLSTYSTECTQENCYSCN